MAPGDTQGTGPGANAALHKLIIGVGPALNAMKPEFHRVRTPWNRGFMPFPPLRRPRIMMLMVPERPECGVRATGTRPRPLAISGIGPGAHASRNASGRWRGTPRARPGRFRQNGRNRPYRESVRADAPDRGPADLAG